MSYQTSKHTAELPSLTGVVLAGLEFTNTSVESSVQRQMCVCIGIWYGMKVVFQTSGHKKEEWAIGSDTSGKNIKPRPFSYHKLTNVTGVNIKIKVIEVFKKNVREFLKVYFWGGTEGLPKTQKLSLKRKKLELKMPYTKDKCQTRRSLCN